MHSPMIIIEVDRLYGRAAGCCCIKSSYKGGISINGSLKDVPVSNQKSSLEFSAFCIKVPHWPSVQEASRMVVNTVVFLQIA